MSNHTNAVLLDEPIEKVYWSVGEAAEVLGVPDSKLRYWANYLDLTIARRNGKDRRFTSANIETLRRFKELLEVDMYTLARAKKKLNG